MRNGDSSDSSIEEPFLETSQLEEEKDNGFITKIESGDWEGAREMIKLLSVDQETLILGLSCLSKPSLLDFLQNFPDKKPAQLFPLVQMRDKEVIEMLLEKEGSVEEEGEGEGRGKKESGLFEFLKEGCCQGREGDLEWLLLNFGKRSGDLPLVELFFFSKHESTTSTLLHYFLPESPNQDQLVKIFSEIPFSNATITYSSPHITNQITNLFPWHHMAQTLMHLNLSNCSLTDLPLGFAQLNPQRIQQLDLKNNPLSGGAKALLQGKARDIVQFVKLLVEKGEQSLKEMMVSVVGNAAVGKTTLLRGLVGKRKEEGGTTNGIEIGEMLVDGVSLRCWDFVGQNILPYVHQFVVPESAIYLVLFNLCDPFLSSISPQLLFWLGLIAEQAPSSHVIVIGTHASEVSSSFEKKTLQQVKELILKKKFGEMVVGFDNEGGGSGSGVVSVDVLSGKGKDELQEVLSILVRQKLHRVPVEFEEIRRLLWEYCGTLRPSQPPVVELKQLQSELQGVGHESWELAVRILDCLGIIVLIECWEDVVHSPAHHPSTFVILRPSWLADLFKTLVTLGPNLVRDGIILVENLRNHCWQGSSVSQELLLAILGKFGVSYWLGGEGGKVFVPCLLGDCLPSNFECLVQGDQKALSLLFSPLSSPSLQQFCVLRRSFLLEKKKQQLSVGLMGKVFSLLARWGKIHSAWKTGCVVVQSDGENGLVVVVWEGWCGSHLGIHFVFFTRAEDGAQSSSSSSSSPFSSSSLKHLPPAHILNHLQQATQIMERLLGESQNNIIFKIITPCSVDQKGIPQEWVELKQVFLAVQQNKSTVNTVVLGSREKGERRGRKVAVEGWLAPDYLPEQALVRFYDETEIVLGKMLGQGSAGEVYEAEVPQKGEKKGKVAGKKIVFDEKLSKWEQIEEQVKEVYQETYFLMKLHHPNVVGLVGMCVETEHPLLLMELLDGDLFNSLLDPLGLKEVSNRFCKLLIRTILFEKETASTWDLLLTSPAENCTKFCDALEQIQWKVHHFPELEQEANYCISQAKKYFEVRDKEHCQLWEESQSKFLETYEQSFNEIAPLSYVGILRIAADISRGLHYLHSVTPSLIHQDLKGPNIFLTCSLAKGGGTAEYASQNVVAKLGDFGMSSLLCGDSMPPAHGRMANINPRWTAPEILGGKNYSVPSDIYSLGLVLWEICYRKLAYAEIEGPFFWEEIKVKVVGGTRPCLSGHPLDEIIQSCWSASPNSRPSAQEVYTSIQSISFSQAPFLFSHLSPISTKGFDGSVVVLDSTYSDTFESIVNWLSEIEKCPGRGEVVKNWKEFVSSLPGCIPFIGIGREKDQKVERVLRKLAEEMVKQRLHYNQRGNTALHTACWNDDREQFVQLLQEEDESLDALNDQDQTPFDILWIGQKQSFQKLSEIYVARAEDEFVTKIKNGEFVEARNMILSSGQDDLLSGALYCLPREDLHGFLEELPLENPNLSVKQTTLLETAVELRNKKVVDLLVAKSSTTGLFFEILKKSCTEGRGDNLKWLLQTFEAELTNWPLNELFYFSNDQITTSLLLHYLLPESQNYAELVKIFCEIPFQNPKIHYSSSCITNQVANLFPWHHMSQSLTHLNLSNCSLTDLPLGFIHLNPQKIEKIDLKGNPLSGVARAILEGKELKDVVGFVKQQAF